MPFHPILVNGAPPLIEFEVSESNSGGYVMFGDKIADAMLAAGFTPRAAYTGDHTYTGEFADFTACVLAVEAIIGMPLALVPYCDCCGPRFSIMPA